jgi:hypothetical protein
MAVTSPLIVTARASCGKTLTALRAFGPALEKFALRTT